MRKWLGIGCLTVALGSLGGYLYLSRPAPVPIVDPGVDTVVHVPIKPNDGGTESSEEDEPIHVDFGTPNERPAEPAPDAGPMPRVVLEPGVQQPPRPDEEAGRAPRMPYADE
jgi:hypothetical protein